MPLDESALPEPDWSKKPIIVIAGDAPNTQEYKELADNLRERIISEEVEVVWVNHTGETPKAKKFIAAGAEGPIFDPMDFSFSDADNPGNERLTHDPELLNLIATTPFGNPPTLVINLYEQTTMIVPINLNEDKWSRFVDVELWSIRHSFLRPITDQSYSRLASQLSYVAMEEGLEKLSQDTWSSLFFRAGFFDLSTRFTLLDTEPEDFRDDLLYFIYDSPGPVKWAHQVIFDKMSEGLELWDEEKRTMSRLCAFQDARFKKMNKNFASDSDDTRKPTVLTSPRILENLLEAFVQNAQARKQARRQENIDPESLPDALREEISELESEHARITRRLDALRREIGEEKEELERTKKRKSDDLDDLNAELDRLQRSIDEKRASFAAETIEHAQKLHDQKAAMLAEVASQTADEKTQLDNERAEFEEWARDKRTQIEKREQELLNEVEIFRVDVNQEAVSRTKEIAVLSELLSDASSLRDEKGIGNRWKFRIARSNVRFLIKNQAALLENIAHKVNSNPHAALHLYDATFFFIAQRALLVTNDAAEHRPIISDAPTCKEMLKTAYRRASEEDRQWFRSLQNLVPADTAQEIHVQFVLAELTNSESIIPSVYAPTTMDDIADTLEKEIREEGKLADDAINTSVVSLRESNIPHHAPLPQSLDSAATKPPTATR